MGNVVKFRIDTTRFNAFFVEGPKVDLIVDTQRDTSDAERNNQKIYQMPKMTEVGETHLVNLKEETRLQ